VNAIGKIGAGLLSAAIVVGGGLLISHFLKPKSPGSTTPTYDFQLGNNTAKPGQPIPVQYGRLKFMPDFSDAPWSDYDGLDQTYHALMCLGVGEFDVEEVGVNTTPIWTSASGFSAGFGGTSGGTIQAHTGVTGDTQGAGGDVQFQMIGPGGTVTLFPSNISAAPDVSGQALPEPYGTVTNGVTNIGPNGETSGPDKVGPFVVNAAGTIARSIAIDLSWPSGMYHIGSNNSYRVGSVQIICEYQYVDDQGHALGNWQTLFDKTFTFMSRSPWRQTVKTSIGPGRVQVRLYRTWALDKDGQTGVNWLSARAYVDGPSSRANVTQIAVQAKADKLLSGWSSQKFYVIATRRVPVWVGASATWVTQTTRNWVWALCDLWADTRYGGAQSRNKIDIPTMVALATAADARGDGFDHRFTSRQSLVDAMTIAAGSSLAQPLPLWDTLSAVRDEARSLPRTVLTDFEIVRGTLKMSYRIAPANATDGVVGQYFDNDTWAIQEVSSTGTVANLQNPSRVVLEGVTDRNQAYRNTTYLDRVNRYRRVTMSLEIEGEGRLLKRGDYVVVSSELPGSWGGSYRIDAYDLTAPAVPKVTLHAAHDWTTTAGQRYIRIKGSRGEPFGPVKCARGAADAIAVLDATDLAAIQTQQGLLLSDMLWRPNDAERPSAVISIGAPQEFQGLVHEIAPGSQEGHLRIDLAPYAAALIYGDPTATLTPLPSAPALVMPTVPGIITGLGAALSQETNAVALTLAGSWQPDSGSETYEAQYSLDNATWYGLYAGAAASFSQTGFSGATVYLRVRGRRGNLTSIAWSQVTVTAPDLSVSLTNLGAVVQYDDISTSLIETLHLGTLSALDDLVAAVAGSSASLQQQIVEVKSATGAAQAGVKQTMTAVTAANAALADYRLDVNASIDATTAAIAQESQARATLVEALSQQITNVSAKTDAGTASGAVRFVALSSLDSGVSAAYDIQISATGAGGSYSSAGLRLEVTSTGVSRIVMTANSFLLANGATKTVPMYMDTSGNITLAGVTYINSTVKSIANTASGSPVMQQDFANGILQIARS